MRRFGKMKRVEKPLERAHNRTVSTWKKLGWDTRILRRYDSDRNTKMYVGEKVGKENRRGMEVKKTPFGYRVKVGIMAFFKNTGDAVQVVNPRTFKGGKAKKKSNEPSNPFRIGRNY